jgi:hypothetical protein
MVQAQAQSVTGDAGLGHFKDAAADPKPVSDTDFGVSQPVDGEVLSKLAVHEIRSLKIFLPVTIGVELIDHQCALLTAGTRKIALCISNEVQPSREDSPRYRPLPDRGSDSLSLPFHIAWQAHIDREDDSHTDESPAMAREFASADAQASLVFALPVATSRKRLPDFRSGFNYLVKARYLVKSDPDHFMVT